MQYIHWELTKESLVIHGVLLTILACSWNKPGRLSFFKVLQQRSRFFLLFALKQILILAELYIIGYLKYIYSLF